jgi:Uma2 family endonuclease
MAPTYPPHQSVVDRLNRRLVTRLGERAIVRVQGSVPARPRSEPQPDVAVLRNREDFYRTAHPEAGEVFLIIEIHRDPRESAYVDTRVVGGGDDLTCPSFPGVTLTVNEILG